MSTLTQIADNFTVVLREKTVRFCNNCNTESAGIDCSYCHIKTKQKIKVTPHLEPRVRYK